MTKIIKNNELSVIQKIQQEKIKMWIKDNRGSVFDFSGWDIKLWKKTYEEIVEYLVKRFKSTNFEVEYYFCLLYLENNLSAKLRYLPWKESVQYARAIGTYESSSLFQSKVGIVKAQNTFKMR